MEANDHASQSDKNSELHQHWPPSHPTPSGDLAHLRQNAQPHLPCLPVVQKGHEGIRNEGGERGMVLDQLGHHRVHLIWPPSSEDYTDPISFYMASQPIFIFILVCDGKGRAEERKQEEIIGAAN